MSKNISFFTYIKLGIIIAAAGVGAGDLNSSAFVGIKLGTAVLWAVVIGALLKYILNEGIIRYQTATGKTWLEGVLQDKYLRNPAIIIFGFYLIIWSFLVAAALISACGIVMYSIWPIFDNVNYDYLYNSDNGALYDKILYGSLFSIVAVLIVKYGKFKIFENIMSICAIIMLIVIPLIALQLYDNWHEALKGILIWKIPNISKNGIEWTFALLGGVGGTLTIISSSYWMLQEGIKDINKCRKGLFFGYVVIALFGIAVILIASATNDAIPGDIKGIKLISAITLVIGQELGSIWKVAFFICVLLAVFSSLLAVWQSAPLIFTNYYNMVFKKSKKETMDVKKEINNPVYRYYLYMIATLPIFMTIAKFEYIQKIYAIFGALFIPLLSITLIILNNKSNLLNKKMCNKPLTTFILIVILLLSSIAGYFALKPIFK